MLGRIARVIIVGTILTLASALYFKEFNWPDYYHIEYGFPLAWVVRTLNTIRGPTDRLAFQPARFVLDLTLWSLVAFLLLFAIDRARRSEIGQDSNQELPAEGTLAIAETVTKRTPAKS